MMRAQFPGRRITAWGAEKVQQCHKYFLKYSSLHLLPKDLRFEHGGAKLTIVPGAIQPCYVLGMGHTIEQATMSLANKHHVLAVFIDIEKAYDKVSKDALLLKLFKIGIIGNNVLLHPFLSLQPEFSGAGWFFSLTDQIFCQWHSLREYFKSSPVFHPH